MPNTSDMIEASICSAWLTALVFTIAPAAAQTPHTHQHSFGDAAKWAQVFDDPQRDAWQKPHEVIGALALKPDAVVADIGAGTGYFAVRFAHMVPRGRVYAIDTEPDMVKHLSERARREALANLVAVKGEPADARIPAPADLIIMVDVFRHVDARERYFAKLRASLKAGGRLAIIDQHAFAARPAPGRAHRAGAGEGRTCARRLHAGRRTRVSAAAVFSGVRRQRHMTSGVCRARPYWSRNN